jgi:hypothetical protein
MATPDPQTQSMIKNLEETTGQSLASWVTIVAKSKLEKHGEIVTLLKTKHGITHGYANLIAHTARQSDAGASAPDDLVDAQYRAKEALRPVYDRLIDAVTRFGRDVEIAPKKGYVSLRRSKQFALLQPSTKTRLDVGINLKGIAPKGRLEASGSFNAMVTHRVRVEQAGDVNQELVGWLKQAYEGA